MESEPTNRTIAMMDTLTIRTASPFKDIFPIRESVLNEIAESMKLNGYDLDQQPMVIFEIPDFAAAGRKAQYRENR